MRWVPLSWQQGRHQIHQNNKPIWYIDIQVLVSRKYKSRIPPFHITSYRPSLWFMQEIQTLHRLDPPSQNAPQCFSLLQPSDHSLFQSMLNGMYIYVNMVVQVHWVPSPPRVLAANNHNEIQISPPMRGDFALPCSSVLVELADSRRGPCFASRM